MNKHAKDFTPTRYENDEFYQMLSNTMSDHFDKFRDDYGGGAYMFDLSHPTLLGQYESQWGRMQTKTWQRVQV